MRTYTNEPRASFAAEASPVSKISASIYPAGALNLLSQAEVARLSDASSEMSTTLRRCALAVLNSGLQGDDAEQLLADYHDFSIEIHQINRGVRIDLENAPGGAFVDGKMIRGIRELLSAVIRDIIYYHTEVKPNPYFDLATSSGITSATFDILRNAKALDGEREPQLVVCWGGHSIAREEYEYTKEVGYQLGLRGLDICTGCGPGAMKGPMKGATIGHSKQRILPGQYVGLSEPGIIAAESPNPIVNRLVIMPDIEKRLESFIRLGHGVVVFPGGAGTAEEILYILGVLLHPDNQAMPFPLVFTGPESAKTYFEQIDAFIGMTLGSQAQSLYQIIVDDGPAVARAMAEGMEQVKQWRIEANDAFYYNWLLTIDPEFQHPFEPTHEAMAALEISKQLPVHRLAANLRRAFSGIVAGNVKPSGVAAVREHGPFEIQGDAEIMQALDQLLGGFVRDHRMKLPGGAAYEPCYRVVGCDQVV